MSTNLWGWTSAFQVNASQSQKQNVRPPIIIKHPAARGPRWAPSRPGSTHILSSRTIQYKAALAQLNQIAQNKLDTHKPKKLPRMSPLIPLTHSVSMFHREEVERAEKSRDLFLQTT